MKTGDLFLFTQDSFCVVPILVNDKIAVEYSNTRLVGIVEMAYYLCKFCLYF